MTVKLICTFKTKTCLQGKLCGIVDKKGAIVVTMINLDYTNLVMREIYIPDQNAYFEIQGSLNPRIVESKDC